MSDHAGGCHEAEQVGQTYFLVMEYLAGTDLYRLVNTGGPLPVAKACEWARQAATGLQYIHERGLVHRDIKPSNLFLVGQRRIKILDLGLAVLRTEDRPASGLTEKGQILGTLDYMAPEQWAGPWISVRTSTAWVVPSITCWPASRRLAARSIPP